ncbi:hypothetical protein INS49_009123 [Diaporthe citri]|uniref:uncharacterized protein n=1 Tax=Diaporthe citri TaxID=83186 RepID=UPI001C7F5C70|nr:uncharacterized protein INS49_009123 [Diaporthe citri]KAG6364020.1 hypothetical protein INS49_009123 [Diaporthe citri]
MHAAEAALITLQRPVIVGHDSLRLLEFDQPTCTSPINPELNRDEGLDICSSTGSSAGHLDAIESIISHHGTSRVTEQNGVTSNDDDDVRGGLVCDSMLGFDKLSQDLYDVHLHKGSYNSVANRASDILLSGQAFTHDEVVDATAGFTKACPNKDPLAIKLEQRDGPGRHYHHFRPDGDGTRGPGAGGSSGTQPNGDLISKMVLIHPEKSTSVARNVIQRAEESGSLQDGAAGSHLQGFNTSTLLHCTRSAPAPGPFMAAVGKLKAVIGIILADMHEPKPAAINTLIATMDEAELAAIGMLLEAMDEDELAADFSTTKEKSPPTGAYWRGSPSSSSATRHTRLDEFPEGVVQRLMPRGGTIYFGMDMDSFTSARIDVDVMDCLRDAAIEAAEDIREQNLGIAFAYTTDPRYKVFNICYDPNLPFVTLAQGFFPGDQPDRWQLGVSSLASVRWVFDHNRAHIPKIFGHEFAHILGLRHYNAGSSAVELRERSFLWPGTRDGDCNTIMRTGVHSSYLDFSDEDNRVIQEFYSKRNGAVVDGVRIMDVDPYERLWDFFSFQVRRLIGLNRP